jgi:hypothetical protein
MQLAESIIDLCMLNCKRMQLPGRAVRVQGALTFQVHVHIIFKDMIYMPFQLHILTCLCTSLCDKETV